MIFLSLLCLTLSGSGQAEIPAVPGGLGISCCPNGWWPQSSCQRDLPQGPSVRVILCFPWLFLARSPKMAFACGFALGLVLFLLRGSGFVCVCACFFRISGGFWLGTIAAYQPARAKLSWAHNLSQCRTNTHGTQSERRRDPNTPAREKCMTKSDKRPVRSGTLPLEQKSLHTFLSLIVGN